MKGSGRNWRLLIILLVFTFLGFLSFFLIGEYFLAQNRRKTETLSEPSLYDELLPPSNFGTVEFECRGYCYCDSIERRGLSSMFSKNSVRISTVVASLSTFLAFRAAKNTFDEDCKNILEYDDSICPDSVSSMIHSKVEECNEKNEDENLVEPKQQKQQLRKHKSTEIVYDGLKFLRLCRLTYEDEFGNERDWDSCERKTRQGDCDGVQIITEIKKEGEEVQLVLVKQYSVEFPAGLIDENDTPENAALRELKEECGLVGKVLSVSDILSMDPGLTSANCKIVHCVVDGDSEENKNPEQELDGTELIEVLYVKKSELISRLDGLAKEGCYIDSKLWAFGIGFSQRH